ncbi:MAG: DUF58 domain-containing protein [Planctomycetes bacterium]|nr:DUF58 domain-containing protein [Planctomycetota bacterium]MBI3848119.1 DUF58 domain-containing protein [Planctomycetota bacterium]
MRGFVDDFGTLDSRQFVIAIRKLADSLAYGIDRSPFLGSGLEYVQSRLYQFGDSVRSMDWRVTARTRKHHVKEYESPKSLPCYLLIDTSASMTVSSVARSKYETALFVAGGLAFACLDRVSPVAVVTVGDRALRGRPTMSKHRVLRWLLDLRHYHYDERTTLSRRLREIAPSLPERSMFVVLSDLHDEGAVPALKRLIQVHDCVVLHFQDPAEVKSLRGTGLFRAREAETGREFVTYGRAQWTDPEIARSELKRAGIDYCLIRTDQPFEPSLRHLFKARGGVGRGVR